MVFTQQPLWKLLGNRLVEAHIRGNAQTTETEILEVGISLSVFP
jgi:hypothetical protein